MKLKYAWITILLLFFSAQAPAQSYQSAADNPTTPDLAIPEAAYTEELISIKTALDQEYAALIKEAEALNSMAGTPLTEEEFETYTKRVHRFNERRADYEERVDQFQQQAQTLHQQQAVNNESLEKAEKQTAASAESLSDRKALLDQEHADLMREREAIVAEGSDPEIFSTTETFEAHRQKVVDFNKRKADYEKRAKAFEEEAKAYNQSLK